MIPNYIYGTVNRDLRYSAAQRKSGHRETNYIPLDGYFHKILRNVSNLMIKMHIEKLRRGIYFTTKHLHA